MNSKFIVGMEVSKKQAYIFKSNKSKEIIGASKILVLITEYLPKKFLKSFGGNEKYSGGGNSFYEFTNLEKAKDFVSSLSYDILEFFPEIEMFFAISKVEDNDSNNLDIVRAKLEEKKSKRKASFRKISFGLEEICDNSKCPAIKKIKDNKAGENLRPVSRDVYLKNLFAEKFDNEELKKEIKKIFREDKKLTDSFTNKVIIEKVHEKQGLKGEKQSDKYIRDFDKFKDKVAIISLDGNGMAKMVDKVKSGNMSEFSKFIRESYETAFNKMEGKILESSVYEKDYSTNNIIPLRKLILAGDDVCYITDARLGLVSLNIFLEELSNKKIESTINELKDEILTACAGMVIVNKKYPFSVAFEKAEELNKSAKSKLQMLKFDNEKLIPLFTFEVVKGELTGSKDKKNKLEEFYLYPDISAISGDSSLKEKLDKEKELISYEKYNEILRKIIKEDKVENQKDNRIGKIKEILTKEFDKNYFDILLTKYIVKKLFAETFELSKNDNFDSHDYTKAIRIIEMLRFQDVQEQGGE